MAFEQFFGRGRGKTSYGGTYLSFNKPNHFNLSNGLIREADAAKADLVSFYMDRDTRRIGLRFSSNPYEAGALSIHRTKNHANLVSASGFMRAYGIPTDQSFRLPVTFDNDSNLWVAVLPESVTLKRAA